MLSGTKEICVYCYVISTMLNYDVSETFVYQLSQYRTDNNQTWNNMAAAQTAGEVCETSVVIVGGGIAGLAAANELLKRNVCNFKILEARKRLGGRIVGIPIGNHKIELGANWIHGVLDNPVYELALKHGLVNIVQTPNPHRLVAVTEQGRRVPFQILQEIHEAYFCFFQRCEEYFFGSYHPPEGVRSVGQHLKLEISIYLENYSHSERHLRSLIFDYLCKRETCISGCHSMEEVDLKALGSYCELPGGNITLPNGYSSILEPLVKVIPTQNIVTDSPVVKINWGGTKVCVVTKEGQTWYCDHVISTIPLGVLQEESHLLFDPPLPTEHVSSLQRLHFGTVDKIFLEFNRPFLHPDISEVILLWEVEETPEAISENWFKKIYSFSKVTETLLLGWISGREAEYMETLSNEVVKMKCTEILRQFLNDLTIPEPTVCVTTSWKKQPFTRGSYTCIGIGGSHKDIEQLGKPLYRNAKAIVVWAGEHTHPTFYSTAHGAYLSGKRAVAEIC